MVLLFSQHSKRHAETGRTFAPLQILVKSPPSLLSTPASVKDAHQHS